MIKRFVVAITFVLGLLFGFGTVAGAQEECSGSPQVCTPNDTPPVEVDDSGLPGDTEALPAAPGTEVKGRQQLPVTGAETATIAFGGLALVLAGGVLIRRSSRAQA